MSEICKDCRSLKSDPGNRSGLALKPDRVHWAVPLGTGKATLVRCLHVRPGEAAPHPAPVPADLRAISSHRVHHEARVGPARGVGQSRLRPSDAKANQEAIGKVTCPDCLRLLRREVKVGGVPGVRFLEVIDA